ICSAEVRREPLGGALVCGRCQSAFISQAASPEPYLLRPTVKSGEAILRVRREFKKSGYEKHPRLESCERLMIPWRLVIGERLSLEDDSPSAQEYQQLTVACELEPLGLGGQSLNRLLEDKSHSELQAEPLHTAELLPTDQLFPPTEPEAQSDDSTANQLRRRELTLYYPYWRVVFTTEGANAADHPFMIDAISGHLLSGAAPRRARSQALFYAGVSALGAYAAGCVINLATLGQLSGFVWFTLIGAIAGIGGLFYLKSASSDKGGK
ncbi:hypothetical protein K8R78_06980, partial [bacterium]|nr:hypothetical protein [bacterium]